MFRLIAAFCALGLLLGCAGFDREWKSGCAEHLGSDWIIVQYAVDGHPFAAWKLVKTSVSNEKNSDGIYWADEQTGHLVHISGWYNRVQVQNGRFDEAAKLLGVDLNQIGNGKYPRENP